MVRGRLRRRRSVIALVTGISIIDSRGRFITAAPVSSDSQRRYPAVRYFWASTITLLRPTAVTILRFRRAFCTASDCPGWTLFGLTPRITIKSFDRWWCWRRMIEGPWDCKIAIIHVNRLTDLASGGADQPVAPHGSAEVPAALRSR